MCVYRGAMGEKVVGGWREGERREGGKRRGGENVCRLIVRKKWMKIRGGRGMGLSSSKT